MRPLEKFYDAYGRLIARHPFPFLIIPVIITVISTYGIQFFHSQDDIWDIYSPLNALSRSEVGEVRICLVCKPLQGEYRDP
ncbi:hypothetical protein L596_001907 [Steinernema carpocapsae]|uniref:Uncharacterized protein n=1 Tax=Steinernema carpocapsae TaxID=34508 RepID=A0A4U8UN42_STECR|nr:hypothetical protein L596_001907 [Steinernema carpocapsae]